MELIEAYTLIQNTKQEILKSELCISVYMNYSTKCLAEDCIECKKEIFKSLKGASILDVAKKNQEIKNSIDLKILKHRLYNNLNDFSESICWKHVIEQYRSCVQPESGQCKFCIDRMFNEYGYFLFFKFVLGSLDTLYESGLIKLVAQQFDFCSKCKIKCTDDNCKKQMQKTFKKLLTV